MPTDQVISQTDALADTVIELLADSAERTTLSHNLHQSAKPEAAAELAAMIIAAHPRRERG